MARRFVGRKPITEHAGPHMTLPGDVKERLQFKPLKGGKKRPAGENWVPFKSKGGTPKTDDCVGPARNELSFKNKVDPAYDDVNGELHATALDVIAKKGFTIDRDAMADRATETHNEHLYEEVVDKETGKKSLLFRNAIFDRI